jgi:hypothetical protein
MELIFGVHTAAARGTNSGPFPIAVLFVDISLRLHCQGAEREPSQHLRFETIYHAMDGQGAKMLGVFVETLGTVAGSYRLPRAPTAKPCRYYGPIRSFPGLIKINDLTRRSKARRVLEPPTYRCDSVFAVVRVTAGASRQKARFSS